MPAPSPMTKPSRSASKGRSAFCGSSLRVDSAFMASKPPMPSGVMVASVPPAIIASASPRWMIREASPMAWSPVAHADTIDVVGALGAVADGDVAGRHVRDDHRDEEGRRPGAAPVARAPPSILS